MAAKRTAGEQTTAVKALATAHRRGRPIGATNKHSNGTKPGEEVMSEFWTVEEACEILNIGTSTGYRLIAMGEFPVKARKIGNLIRIGKADLAAYIGG